MNNEAFTIDLHCHPNLKSFNSGYPTPQHSMWEKIEHKIDGRFARIISETSQHVMKESQCNLYALADGNVRVFNVSLYPVERGFLHLRNIPKILIGKNRINILHEVLTGFDANRIMHLKKHANYFDDLLAEYKYVFQEQGKSPDGKKEFILAN